MMLRSETFGVIAGALAKAQAAHGDYTKSKQAEVRSDRGNYKYAYATLADALDAVRASLTSSAIAVVQPVRIEGRKCTVATWLMHESGEYLACELSVELEPQGKSATITPQQYGSAITYLRRYGITSMVGIAPDDDDDGRRASGITRKEPEDWDAEWEADADKFLRALDKRDLTLVEVDEARAAMHLPACRWVGRESRRLIIEAYDNAHAKPADPLPDENAKKRAMSEEGGSK